MHLEADVFAYWLSSAPVALRKYPGLGHYAYIEEPAVVSRDVADFLAGNLDSELRAPCPAD
jgi:pimeloyl-ACP methyl ester carboxylesterase